MKYSPELFSKNLKEIREFLGLTHNSLAKRAGLTAAAICQIETGKREPSLKSICKILEALSCDFDRMMKP